MNRAKLKTYAPQARREFIQAMKDRAEVYGLTLKKIEPVVELGDVAVIAGREHPRSVARKRKALEDRIHRDGFEQTMEALAYTWFNRLVALRFMELHGYLDHGYRVLSHPEGKPTPEILQHAEHVDLPGLKREEVIDLKLDGNKEGELYRLLLVAQCNALNRVMPFLFEKIDDETELLLPDNLLHSDSLIRKLVSNLDEEDCESVEVFGWLYQFYISERKDQVMARKSAVPTEDIPAVTQLFTPHWIVRYLVENSLGRLWLLNRPGSRLRDHMPYYIEGEPETDFLKITRPEEIRVLDPAVGSGHMLTYAFDLLTLIYEEEGYTSTEIPALILRHNLYGLDICPRAAQLAALALVFKARAKSRRFFEPAQLVPPHIIELQDVRFADNELRDYIHELGLGDLFKQPMLTLLHQFEEATNFGSLIQPCLDEQTIAYARSAIAAKNLGDKLLYRETHLKVLRVLDQAEALTQRYHVVVANPPYMKGGFMSRTLKRFADEEYPQSKANIYAMFLERCLSLARTDGLLGMVNLHGWMFTVRYEKLRKQLINETTFITLIHLGANGFDEISGEVVQTTAFVLLNTEYNGVYATEFYRLVDGKNEAEKAEALRTRQNRYLISCARFLEIDGAPMAYWLSSISRSAFRRFRSIDHYAEIRAGLQSGDNQTFLRYWYEVCFSSVGLGFSSRSSAADSGKKWFPHNKGGLYRRWYGNGEYLILWEHDGAAIKARKTSDLAAGRVTPNNAKCWNQDYYFLNGFSWTALSTGNMSARDNGYGYLFDTKGQTVFPHNTQDRSAVLGYLNSSISTYFLQALSPTLDFNGGTVGKLPLPVEVGEDAKFVASVQECVSISRADWDNFETSWDFRDLPLLQPGLKGATLEASWRSWVAQCTAAIRRMQELETENNRLLIAAYGLEGELEPEVPDEQITLARADAHRDVAGFLSYAVGCMMGRYSLDHPGLILANAGDTVREFVAKLGRRPDQLSFVPDEDGIIPVLDYEWFDDDIVARAREFLSIAFGEATLGENLCFIEESLGKDLRKYFLTDFYKDHLQTYKKRPIYWMFSSGKQRAFQCLVYLHRYNEGTLARMRTEYVIPLQGRIAARIEQLEGDKAKASSTSHRNKLQKEQDNLKRQQAELLTFDEKLKHYADQRISLDLDDGVKVNYGKFGDLLAEVKAITGGAVEE